MLAGLMAGTVPAKYMTRLRVSVAGYVLDLTPTQAETLKLVSYLNPPKGMHDSQYTSSGAFATTFRDADGRVVKITSDPDDLFAMLLLQGVTAHVPKVYAAYQMKFPLGNYYAIVVEYIHSFDRKNAAHLDQAYRVSQGMAFATRTMTPKAVGAYNRIDSWNVDSNEAKRQACADGGGPSWAALTSRDFGMRPEECDRLMNELLAICEKVAPYGLRLVDTHVNNMGLRDPNDLESWVIRDLGASGETDSKPAVPTLAGLSETQLARIFRRLS